MTRLPVVDCALEGFRVTRERPAAVAVWGAWLLLSTLATNAVVAASGLGPVLDQMGAQAGRTDPAAAQATLSALSRGAPALLALLVISYGFGIVFYTALLRAVLSPAEAGRTFFLRAGADEARQLGLLLFALVALLAYATALAVASGLLIALAAAAGPAGQLLSAAVVAGLFIALLYPVVRLSLAPAATFQAKRIVLFRSWRLTRGRFWPMLSTYALALGLAALVWLLAVIVFGALGFAVVLAMGGGLDALRDAMRPDVSSLPALFSPASLTALVFSAFMGALIYVVTAAPGPAVHRALAAADPALAAFD